jgi:hypothetical protein
LVGRPFRYSRLLAVLAGIFSVTGCNPESPNRLIVATCWPLAARRLLESDFQEWQVRSARDPDFHSSRLEWLVLTPANELASAVRRGNPPDVLLGGSALSYARLAQIDQLVPIEGAGSASWRTCALANRIHALTDAGPSAFGDPRTDRECLAWSIGQIDRGRWRAGFSRLVRAAGVAERGRPGPDRQDASTPLAEGVAIVRASRAQGAARHFMRFLSEASAVELGAAMAAGDDGLSPEMQSLVADLLGAILVDARDEFWAAWSALERAGYPEPALKWMSEPFPWPPASVAKFLGRQGENAMSLVETLALELAPDPEARGWLVRSWLSPSRPVDDTLLNELGKAASGRLVREPRFRAWLQAEWTASARQRYRRVARLVADAKPSPASS